MAAMQLHKAEDRGSADYGWFKARYSFSFGQWHDPNKMGFGVLRVLNDSVIQPGKGFPPHSHDNFEVITVQLEGRLNHTDISGTRVIQAGDVQAITAGSGVTHSDLNIGNVPAKQFQIWIAPDKRNIAPASTLHHFPKSDFNDRWQTLVGPAADVSVPLHIQQQAWIRRGRFSNSTIEIKPLGPENGLYVMVISGEVNIGDLKVGPRDAVSIEGGDPLRLRIDKTADLLSIEVPMNN